MSSILKGFDSSNIAENSQIFDFDTTYLLGDVVPDEVAENVIDVTNNHFRVGDFILVKEVVPHGYVYAVVEEIKDDRKVSFNTGNADLSLADSQNVFKIKDYRCFETKNLISKDKPLSSKKRNTLKWADRKFVRLEKYSSPQNTIIQDASFETDKSTYKYLLQHKSFSKDVSKFLKISIISEIVKNHSFTPELALTALRIKVLHDDELIEGFDKAIEELEKFEKSYRKEKNSHAKDLTAAHCQKASTVLKLFFNEIIKRGLEDRVT